MTTETAPIQEKQLLSEDELSFLWKISTPQIWILKRSPSALVVSLIQRGYCKTSPVRIGPLGIFTGESSISLTEAGRSALEAYNQTF